MTRGVPQDVLFITQSRYTKGGRGGISHGQTLALDVLMAEKPEDPAPLVCLPQEDIWRLGSRYGPVDRILRISSSGALVRHWALGCVVLDIGACCRYYIIQEVSCLYADPIPEHTLCNDKIFTSDPLKLYFPPETHIILKYD